MAAAPSLAALGHTITEKLTRDNFLVWKAQVLPHVRAAAMMGYLDGSIKEPPAVLLTEREVSGKKEVTETPNPAHAVWVTQDQQVLSFLLASLSREVLLQVSDLDTATKVWTTLLQSFSSQSRAKIIQLRAQISSARKGDLSAAAYFTKVKGLADELAAAGKPLDEDEIVSDIIQGLVHEPDYNGFVSAISTRTVTDQPIGLGELFSLLLAAEARIEAQNSSSGFSANLAAKGGNRNYGRPSGGNGSGGSRGANGNSSGSQDGRGPRFSNNNGGGAPRPGGGEKERCQICKFEGHGAWCCKKRYDRSYNNNVKHYGGQGGGGGGGDKSANATAHAYGVDTNWYLDTGATDHVTGELEKLAVRDRYTGNEQIHTASGQGSGHSQNNSPRQE